MELILRQDVDGLGFKDDIVTVKNGFGRNYLIPQGSAILATISAKKVLAENLKQRAFKDKKIVDDANKIAKAISELEIKMKQILLDENIRESLIINGKQFIDKYFSHQGNSCKFLVKLLLDKN